LKHRKPKHILLDGLLDVLPVLIRSSSFVVVVWCITLDFECLLLSDLAAFHLQYVTASLLLVLCFVASVFIFILPLYLTTITTFRASVLPKEFFSAGSQISLKCAHLPVTKNRFSATIISQTSFHAIRSLGLIYN